MRLYQFGCTVYDQRMNLIRILLLLSVILLAACDAQQLLANRQITHKPSYEAITFAVAQLPRNFDPRLATDAASERINRLLYQPLIDFDVAAKPVAKLGRWQWLGEKQFQYELSRPLPTFHHGKRLTAHDVKATYDSIQTLPNSPLRSEFSNIKEIQVLSDDRLIFKLKQADNAFAEKLIIGILPKDLIATSHDFANQPVGSGAMQWVDGKTITQLERVKDGQLVEIIEVKDPTVRVLKLVRGEVDLLQGDLQPELVKLLQKQTSLNVVTGQGANFSYLGFNYQDSVLKQADVRKAIAHAVDVPAIINTMMVPSTTQAGAILPPSHYAGNKTLTPYAYRPALAKQLLIQAGIQLPLKLVYKTSTDAQRVRLATIMQAQMRKAGIELTINSLDWGTFFEDIKQGKFQLYGLTWVGIKTADIYAKVFHSQAVPPNGLNRGRFANAAIDTMLEQQDWQSATRAIHQALPYLPLWYEGQFIAAQKGLAINAPAADGNWDMLATVRRVEN